MKKLKFKSVLGVALAGVIALFAAMSPVSADESSTQEGARIGITPVTQKISLNPGDEFSGTFRVVNGSDNNLSFKYTVYATPFQVKDKNYEKDFSTENAYTKLADWIEFSKTSGTLEANSEEEIKYTIKVPTDVPAGGQYAAIMAAIDNSEPGSVKTSSRAALTIYAHVAGETRLEGSIKENSVPSVVFGGSKINATSLVENKGNIDADAKYTVKIFPFGSGEEVFTNEDSPDTRTILPETERYHTVTWEETPQLGIFTVEQTIEFMGQTSTTSKLVLVCPVWLIIIFIALIFAIIFTIVSRARARKQSKGESSAHRSTKSDSKED